MRPPEPRGMADYLTAPCKHEYAIFKERRHITQAHRVLVSLDPIKSALTRASAGKCGVDSSCCMASTVEAVVGTTRILGTGMKRVRVRCFVQLHSTAFASPTNMQYWSPLSCRRFVPPYETDLYEVLVQKRSSLGNATREGVEVRE